MTAAEPSGVVVLLLWLVLIAVAVPLLVADVRLRYFSGPMFDWFKKVLPPISATERDAIDAGTVWWDGELFSGRPDWDTLLGYPKARLTNEEQAFLDGPTRNPLCAGQRMGHRQRMDLPPAAWDYIKAEGFFAPDHPQGIWRQGLLRLCPFADRDEARHPQRRPCQHRDGAQLPRPGRVADALRHRGATQPLPATPGQRHRHPLLRPHRPLRRSDAGA